LEPTIKVYPNPAADYLKVLSSKNGTVDILTVSGKRILQNQAIRANTEKQISTLNWPAGLYILELKAGDIRVTRKVVLRP
jgi:hypothetical protein